jgi:DNA polymerase elongation subunit (family B)
VLCDALGNLTRLRYFFKGKRDTFMPKSRDWEIYDAKQKGTKTQLLSAYGMQGSPKSRFYSVDNAENITLSCQLVQGYAVTVSGKLGAPTLYGVTDSIMIKLADSATIDDCILLGQMICEEVNRQMQEFTKFTFKNPQYQIRVDLDRLYERLLLTKKKQKYSGIVCFEEDKRVHYVHTMGFQSRKGDTPKLAKAVQDKVLDMRLNFKPGKEIQSYLDEVKRDLFAGKYDKQLVVSKGLSMPVENYKSPIPPHVRVVKQLAKQGIDVRVGDKVKYITVGQDRSGRVEVVPYLDYAPPKLQVYEYKFIWERSILKVVEDIMPERKICTLMEQWQ